MNRIVAVSPATVAAVKPIHATVIHFNVERRVTPSTSRSGAAATTSSCFWTVAISSRSAYQNRAAALNIHSLAILRSPTRHSRYGDGASEATKDLLREKAGIDGSRSFTSLRMTK